MQWHVTNYPATKQNNINRDSDLNSPCFYVGGYFFRLSLRHYRTEQGTFFLSLYINNGPGPHDDSLVWPFPEGKFNFYLYNHLQDGGHLNFSFDAPANEWKSKPTNWRGWGRQSAWSHQEIEKTHYQKYIDGGTIIIGFNITFTKSWLF
ncbi:MAG: hypothetical protein ACXV2C_01180 [Candidatus Bathyarchaeia archaeon]